MWIFISSINSPCAKRVEVLYKFRDLLIRDMDELTHMLCRENGKNREEARGDLLKVKEPVEVACGAPSLMMGESLMNATAGYDSTLYREPIGVFAGIAPFNRGRKEGNPCFHLGRDAVGSLFLKPGQRA